MRKSDNMNVGVALGVLGFVLAMFGAWITHAVWVVKVLASDAGATGGQMLLGIIGLLVPPVGVIHGILMWMGVA